MVKVVPIDRADIVKPELFEQGAAHGQATGKFICPAGRDMERFGQFARYPLGEVAQLEKRAGRNDPCQIGRKPAHRRRNRHVVVVEDHDQPVPGRRSVVHRLIGHARAHRAVTDHRDALARLARQLVGDREAQRRRNRGRAVRRAEGIIFALGALGEAGKTASCAQSPNPVPPPGQNLVRIALMPDIPDQPVFGRVENIMDGRRQLHDAQTCSQMATSIRNSANRLSAQFVCQLAELFGFQPAQVGGNPDCVEQRGIGTV